MAFNLSATDQIHSRWWCSNISQMYGRFFSICCYFGRVWWQILTRAGFCVIICWSGLFDWIRQNKEWMLVSKSGPRLGRLSFEVFVWSVEKLREEIGKRQTGDDEDDQNDHHQLCESNLIDGGEFLQLHSSFQLVSQASLLLKQMLLLYKQSNWFHKQPNAHSSRLFEQMLGHILFYI